jgi:hypothetical protein
MPPARTPHKPRAFQFTQTKRQRQSRHQAPSTKHRPKRQAPKPNKALGPSPKPCSPSPKKRNQQPSSAVFARGVGSSLLAARWHWLVAWRLEIGEGPSWLSWSNRRLQLACHGPMHSLSLSLLSVSTKPRHAPTRAYGGAVAFGAARPPPSGCAFFLADQQRHRLRVSRLAQSPA